MWVAPLAIGYIVKKYEQKQAKKQQEKAMAKNTAHIVTGKQIGRAHV